MTFLEGKPYNFLCIKSVSLIKQTKFPSSHAKLFCLIIVLTQLNSILPKLTFLNTDLRQEPCSSGKGRGLMIKRSWVRTPAQYTGWM